MDAAMKLYARCMGYTPQDTPCPYRDGCVRYRQTSGDTWLSPVHDKAGHCYDRITDLGLQMMGEDEGNKKPLR